MATTQTGELSAMKWQQKVKLSAMKWQQQTGAVVFS
jgi:hypothetical protein